jgi:hypothetical protein
MTARTILIATLLFTGIISQAQSTDSSSKNVSVPIRFGIFPGLSTQGSADIRTTSNISINLWGGLTGSVNGVEFGSLFNIDKGNVQFVQAAGIFNKVGGNLRGVQSAGVFNMVDGNVTGVQYAGVINLARGNVAGLQSAGVHNHAAKGMTGIQAGGVSNFSGGIMKGVQVAGVVNVAKHVKGLQIGVINIADTSEGFHIGLINIVKKGYHKLYVSANEVMNANIAIKTGNPKLYNILIAGVNPGSNDKVFSYGYGLGREIKLGKSFTLNPELTSQYLYLGNWNYDNWLSKFQLLVNIRLAKNIALTGGPSFAVYYSDQKVQVKGYKLNIPSYNSFELWDDNVKGWIGWTAGLTFF